MATEKLDNIQKRFIEKLKDIDQSYKKLTDRAKADNSKTFLKKQEENQKNIEELQK